MRDHQMSILPDINDLLVFLLIIFILIVNFFRRFLK